MGCFFGRTSRDHLVNVLQRISSDIQYSETLLSSGFVDGDEVYRYRQI
jgi:hypothetical protein